MNTIAAQVQLKLSLSQQLNDLLQKKAAVFGVPATQFVKHLIIREVEQNQYPTFVASDWTQQKVQEALENEQDSVSVDAADLHQFFKELA